MNTNLWKRIQIRKWVVNRFGWPPYRRFRLTAVVEAADEIPNQLDRYSAILVGSEKTPKWIAFDCPCRTGHRIMLNADTRREPNWRIDISIRRKLTIYPSVDHIGKYERCHYFIKSGKIIWVSEDDE